MTNQHESGPLYLSDYINHGNVNEGKEAALVAPFCGNVKSYSGFLTVGPEKTNHMFFWFFPSEWEEEDTPLVVWLNGFGTMTTFGIFFQNGPFMFEEKELKLRELSWHKWYNVLYIDSPVGMGFSHGPKSKHSRNITSNATNLYSVLAQFYQLFPELKSNEIYLTGISMAGTYIIHLAKEIVDKNDISVDKINLRGICMLSPMFEIGQQIGGVSDFMYNLGFLDLKGKSIASMKEKEISQLIQDGSYELAGQLSLKYLHFTGNCLSELTGLKSVLDVRLYDCKEREKEMRCLSEFLMQKDVRRQLHVGSVSFQVVTDDLGNFATDLSKPSSKILEKLLNRCKVLYCIGQFDSVCSYPTMSSILNDLNWSGKEQFKIAARSKFEEDGKVYGFTRTHGNLTEVLIRNAGHAVIETHPQHILKLLRSFTKQGDMDINL